MPNMTEEQFNKIPEKERYSTLKGLLYYAKVHTPQIPDPNNPKTKLIKPSYGTVLAFDTKERQKDAESLGFDLMEATMEIPHPHIRLQRRLNDLSEADDKKPDVVDSMQNPIPPSVLIGNGSEGIVKFARYYYDGSAKGTAGVKGTLLKIQVTNLVRYEPEGDFVKDPTGFVVSQEPSMDNTQSGTRDNPFGFDEGDSVEFDPPTAEAAVN